MIKTFLLGALGYPLLEILYRGRTHAAMGLAGGVSLLWLRRCAAMPAGRVFRALAGALGITAIEYAAGLCFNRRHRIWDYRGRPGNLSGQVCPAYFLIWYGISLLLTGRKKCLR